MDEHDVRLTKSAVRKEKKLRKLNGYIAKGRIKYTLHNSLIIIAGLTVVHVTKGLIVPWIFEMWLFFVVGFLVFYAWGWKNVLRKANKLATELNLKVAPHPPEVEYRHCVATFLIVITLLSPVFFKEQILKKISENRKEATIELRQSIKVNLSIPYGDEAISLTIPSSYFVKAPKMKMGIEFLESDLSDIRVYATLPHMEPHYEPIATIPRDVREKLKGYRILQPKFKGADPRTKPRAVIIEIEKYQSHIDESIIKTMLTKMNLAELKSEKKYGLQILSGHIFFVNDSPSSLFAYPDMKENQNLYIGCVEDLCALFVSHESLPDLTIYIHKNKLEDWKQISEKATELIQEFKTSFKENKT